MHTHCHSPLQEMVEYSAAADRLAKLTLHPTTTVSVKRCSPPSSLQEPTPKKQQLHHHRISDTSSQNLSASPPNPSKPLLRTASLPQTRSPNSISSGDLKNSGKQSPSSKKLKRIRDQMRKLIQRWHQILQEEEEIETDWPEGNDDSADSDNSGKEKGERKTGEAVRLEKTGDGSLLIHFKCPCNRCFQILVSSNDCYYKLL